MRGIHRWSTQRASNAENVSIWWHSSSKCTFERISAFCLEYHNCGMKLMFHVDVYLFLVWYGHYFSWLKPYIMAFPTYMFYHRHLHRGTCKYKTSFDKQVLFENQLSNLISCLQFIEFYQLKRQLVIFWKMTGRYAVNARGIRGPLTVTSSNGNISTLLAICTENSPVTGEFPSQRPVTRSFDVFFDLCLNNRLSKQWWGWWFETPSCPLWRHCYAGFLIHCPLPDAWPL